MKTKKKAVIITICVCLFLIVILVAFHFSKNFLVDLGIIHVSEKEAISFFDKNKDDLKIVADYVLDKCTFFDESTDTQESDKNFKQGEIIESIAIYRGKGGDYRCDVYNKITSNIESKLLKEIQPYDISPEAEPSFNKIIRKGYVSVVLTDETNNKSPYIQFTLKGYAIYDQQHIVYFKDKEHDLDFMFGYKVVPLSEEGWYYLALGDAENW